MDRAMGSVKQKADRSTIMSTKMYPTQRIWLGVRLVMPKKLSQGVG